MRTTFKIFFLAMLIMAGMTPAHAGESITLDQVVNNAVQKSTGMFQLRKDYEEGLANSNEAKAFDNPEVQTDIIRKQGSGGTGLSVEIMQPLKPSQMTGTRFRYARLLAQSADAGQQYALLKVINETTALYTRLWLMQERKHLIQDSARDAGTMSKLVHSSAHAGQTSVAAAQLFSADAAKLESDAFAMDAELRQARIDLTKLTGMSFRGAELQKPSFSQVPEDIQILVSFSRTRVNLRNLLNARVKAAQERVSGADQDAALPEFGPRLIYSRTPDGAEKDYGIGVQLRIPLWNQNNAERKRANAELNFERSQADLLAQVPPEQVIADLQQGAIAAQKRAGSYFNKILPGYRKSYELMHSMFRQGQADAFEVWQVREKLYQTENEGLDAVVEALNARGLLELELGGKLEEIK